MIYSAKISFNGLNSGKRVTRSFSTNDSAEYLKWINSYLKMPLREVDFRFDEISKHAVTDFRWPKKLRKVVGI